MADAERGEARLPAVVRAYEAQRATRARARRLTEAVADGVFLGLMDRSDLAALDHAFYTRVRETVDGHARLYGDDAHIRGGLHDWEERALRAAFPAEGGWW